MENVVEGASCSGRNASTQKDAIEAGWAELMTSPALADCIDLADADLFDVEPLR